MTALMVGLLVGACTPAVTAGYPRLGGEIEFKVSGGLAGVRRSLRIFNDGQVVARDDRRGTEARQKLDSARLAQIKAAFPTIATNQAPGARGQLLRCADCFLYLISATLDNVHHRVSIQSGAPPNADYGKAAELLLTILRETLSR